MEAACGRDYAVPTQLNLAVMPFADNHWWFSLDALVTSADITVDRVAGSCHPRFPDTVYPLNYGYLRGTNGGDGSGIDVWLGRSGERRVVVVACCVDRLKRDLEMKLLLGCSRQEVEQVRRFLSRGEQAVLMIERA